MRGCLITGTDTDVGKTVVAAAICAALVERGVSVSAVKPAVSGVDGIEAGSADHELLARITGTTPARVTTAVFGPPLSPHLAAELAHAPLHPATLVAHARSAADIADVLVAEGVGGFLVPLCDDYLIRDYAVDLGLPVIVVARPGLGTINHTLLTLEAVRAAGLELLGVVLTPWPVQPSVGERSNRSTIAELGEVEVTTLAQTALDAASLARAGAALPLDRWLAAQLTSGASASA